MKLFKNQRGTSDIVVVSIILGMIGALFITGVFVWQEVESGGEILRLQKILNEKDRNISVNSQKNLNIGTFSDVVIKNSYSNQAMKNNVIACIEDTISFRDDLFNELYSTDIEEFCAKNSNPNECIAQGKKDILKAQEYYDNLDLENHCFSLEKSRAMAWNVAVKSTLVGLAVPTSTAYFDKNNSYEGLCSLEYVKRIEKVINSKTEENNIDYPAFYCYDNEDGWKALGKFGELIEQNTGYWCIDYTGNQMKVDGITDSIRCNQ